MLSDTEDLYLQKMEEFVYDEDKIVTFKWLSIKLNINVVDARRLLEKYVTDHRTQKPAELAVVYLLSGVDESNNLVVSLAKETELEEKSSCLKEVLNKQLYSVQKCKEVDLGALNLVDYFDMHNPRNSPLIGSIRSKNCIKRIFKQKKALPPIPAPTIKGKTSFFTKITPKNTEKETTNSKENTATKNQEKVNSKHNGAKPAGNANVKHNGFTNFFTKGDVKPTTQQKVENITKPETKHISDNKTVITKPESNHINDNKTVIERIGSLVEDDSGSEDIISPTPNVQKQKQRRSVKRSKKQNKNKDPSPKRRKRIIQHDSDSDDIFGNDEEDEMDNKREESDEESEPKFKPQLPLPPMNKKRKLVDRTYTDEEGYIITRKEWIEESGSEGEPEVSKENKPEEVIVNKVESKPEKKVIQDKSENRENKNVTEKAINGKGKGAKNKKPIAANQQTLMSFFKKK